MVKNVPGLPVLERKEKVQIIQPASLQEATQQYAKSENFMSGIGASVAQNASNGLAAKLGQESGKHPTGDLFPSLTEFDKNFEKSYTTQAHATLGMEADKLITSINLQISKQPRISQKLIDEGQKNIAQGLQKIYAVAPSSIRPQLEKTYNDVQLNQLESLTKRMLSEQHEDRRNNTILANDKNAELAHSLAASGKYEAAEGLVKSTKALNDSAIAGNIGFTPQQGKVGTDSVRQAAIAGRLQFEYNNAVKEKKGEEYLKNLANRPDWISDKDYPEAVKSIRQYVGGQEALKSNYEELTMTDFRARIATDASSITGTELQSTLDKLSPINAAKLNLAYITGVKAQQQEHAEAADVNQNWNDPRAFANATDKPINKAFSDKVQYVIENNPKISREAAENQVAASAGGEIPVFTKILKNGLWSGNAASMVATARQIADLQQNGNGHALQGLSDKDLALFSDIQHNFNPADPAAAARMIADNRENQNPEKRKLSQEAFANQIFDNTRKNNKTTDDYVLEQFGMQGGLFHQGFSSPWDKSNYATDILSNWRANFINTGRDNDRAKELTQAYVKNNYGKTQINGQSQWTLHPIEKAVGLPIGEGINSIHKDIERQLTPVLEKLKEHYDAGITHEYWTIEHEKETTKMTGIPHHMQTRDKQSQLNFIKHTRQGVGTKTEKYPLRLVGNNFNWDINVETNDGPMSVYLATPTLGVHTYTPDVEWIQEDYMGKNHYKNQLGEKYIPQANKLLNSSGEGKK